MLTICILFADDVRSADNNGIVENTTINSFSWEHFSDTYWTIIIPQTSHDFLNMIYIIFIIKVGNVSNLTLRTEGER